MASFNMVWIKCVFCAGSGVDGQEMVAVHSPGVFGLPGSTTWENREAECTNCMGDGGHRMRVRAPDPEPNTSTPDWYGHDGALD